MVQIRPKHFVITAKSFSDILYHIPECVRDEVIFLRSWLLTIFHTTDVGCGYCYRYPNVEQKVKWCILKENEFLKPNHVILKKLNTIKQGHFL